ncbi:hypothetical protein D4764_05G0009710 [Takifugu flavidus]|uniref:Alkylated DNA repair protein AlkB homologue 8 N-terminal domain-containing protein n=1 Tax=Takifugu flavidus TaxID=433684 RepID=A0A5C6N3F2_9TELE|nr:hypothetical protein D4764_05G0009710 [Takifugu flavidus]
MIVDFRKVTAPLPPLALMDSPITIADSFRFLGTTITRDLKWEPTISSLIKKAQQRMFFLRQLRKLKLPPRMWRSFIRPSSSPSSPPPSPCGRRLRSIRTKTSRYMNSFFPSAIRLLNTK